MKLKLFLYINVKIFNLGNLKIHIPRHRKLKQPKVIEIDIFTVVHKTRIINSSYALKIDTADK